MTDNSRIVTAIFYCRNIPDSTEEIRQELEKEHGEVLRLFPLACSGRIESLHLLKALEDFADSAFLITCPEGACVYFEGNKRALKRIEMARSLIESIGLEKERIDIITGSANKPKSLSTYTSELAKRAEKLGRSPVHDKSREK